MISLVAGVDLLDVRDTEPATVHDLRKTCVLFCFVLSAVIGNLMGHEIILSYLQLQMGMDTWFSRSGARHTGLCLFPGAVHSAVLRVEPNGEDC